MSWDTLLEKGVLQGYLLIFQNFTFVGTDVFSKACAALVASIQQDLPSQRVPPTMLTSVLGSLAALLRSRYVVLIIYLET